jgi:hypothetical protein
MRPCKKREREKERERVNWIRIKSTILVGITMDYNNTQ